jgi:histone acetyltransferase MYST1
MDEWIDATRIEQLPSEANAIMKERKRNLENSTLNPDSLEPLQKRRKGDGDDRSDTVEGDQSDGSGEDDGLGGEYGPTTIHDNEHDEHEGMDENQLREHEEITKVKNIRNVLFGRHDIECWYYSPFPKEFYPDGPIDYLYFCEFSMRFFRRKDELTRSASTTP